MSKQTRQISQEFGFIHAKNGVGRVQHRLVSTSIRVIIFSPPERRTCFHKGSGYFASRVKIAPCYFAIWRQSSPNGYFAASAKIALSLMEC